MAPDSEANGGGFSDGSDAWGVGGVVGDGRYRMTYRLGRGGMAEVYAAEDVRLGRTVAVKLLRSDLAEDPVSKARFTREAQSVAGLNHHAIVAVYDSGEDTVGGQTVPYIVMELVEGRTIRDLLLTAEAPPPEQALIIVSGVLEALAYSHQHGIVHRDIKPANVIITDSGAVKVMDFGIARALHGAQSTMTQTGMVMGTPQYLSPEQALGKAVDHRSDLYATGCLLYELLALRPPFTGETPLSVVYQHVQDTPVQPSEVSDVVPPELDGLVMRSLAKDPDDRFQSAEEMRGLVQYSLQMLQVQGGHTGTWNTGPVAPHEGGQTPPHGMTGSTRAMGHPMHGDTSQGPILPPMNPDDGGYNGYDGGHGGQRGGGRRNKMWLFVLLALIAIGAGVAFAINAAKDDDGNKKTPVTPSTSVSSSEEEPSETPSDEEEPTEEEPEQPSTSTGGQTQPEPPPYTPPPTQSQPSFTPSPTPSDNTDAGTTDGNTNEGTTGEPSGDPTDPTTDPGTPGGGNGGEPGGSEGANGGASAGSAGNSGTGDTTGPAAGGTTP
ncbi:serine/threonine protein kinase [Streptomyces sp. CS090A]|uniref:protein kinase domain-containing protein n=1 Tax=Streptomyces TaxID=1883 RepID=UPI000D510587|nr:MULTISPECIES: protein kinase [Streptomyces]PVC92362.1 serine/threonine protein kinase [Streptomyces sp. CS090A]WRO11308.1 protein kinase [Streptomyces cyaneofuscatus]